MTTEEIVQQVMISKWNKDRVQAFVDLDLNPKYGMAAAIMGLMYQLYSDSSGDHQYDGKMWCASCGDLVYRKLKDFLIYNDNMGHDLINWEPKQKPAPFSKNNKI